MSAKYPPPKDRAEFEQLLFSQQSEERLRAAMASFQLNDPVVSQLLARRLVAEGNNLVKATLVKAVGRFQDPGHLDLLAGFLSDPDSRVRANAVEALGFFRDPQVVPLLQPLVQDESSRVRGNALLILGRFHRERTLAYVNQLAVAPDPRMRETAVYVLGRVGGKYGISRLVAMGRREAEWTLKKAIVASLVSMQQRGDPLAAQGLAALQDGEALPPSAELASVAPGIAPQPPPEPEAEVDPPASGEWPMTSTPPAPENPVRYPEDLRSAVPRRRLEAVQLAPEGGPEVFQLLSGLLQEELDEFVIATLVKKLGKVGGMRAYPLILPYLRNPDGRVRANTLEGVEATGSPETLSVVRGMLEDAHPRVRAVAARILASHKREQGKAVAVLKGMLLEGDEKGALSAVHALESIDAGVILEIMELALVQPQPRVRARVLQALQILGERNSLAARLHKKYAGGETFEDEEYVNRLLARMNSKDEEVRYEALQRLSLIRSEKVQSRIELATSDASARVRNLAKAVVEDFGKAYKRQGVLHSLGLRAAEALRAEVITLEQGAPELEELDQVARRLEGAEEEAPAASELLARRREIMVGLGERVYRELPGCQVEDVRELLEQLRDLDGTSGARPRPDDGVNTAVRNATSSALRETMKELEDGLRSGGSPSSARSEMRRDSPHDPPTAAETLQGLAETRLPKHLFLVAFIMLVVGGVLLYIQRNISANILEVSKGWTVPVESACYVARSDEFVFAATRSGEVLALAAPTGVVKWRRPIEGLVPETLRAGGRRLYLFTKLDQVLAVSGARGEVEWTASAGGGILPGARLGEGILVTAVGRAEGGHEVKSLLLSDGKKQWSAAITTGAPGALTVSRGSVYLASGSTFYRLDAQDGRELYSFDYGEDFIPDGPVALTDEGVALVATPKRVVAIGPSGSLEQEGAAGTGERPVANPIRLAARRYAVVGGAEAWVLDDTLQEISRLALPLKPELLAVAGRSLYLSDGSTTVVRLAHDEAGLRVVGATPASGLVRSLAAVGEHVLVGSRSGVEVLTAQSFE